MAQSRAVPDDEVVSLTERFPYSPKLRCRISSTDGKNCHREVDHLGIHIHYYGHWQIDGNLPPGGFWASRYWVSD